MLGLIVAERLRLTDQEGDIGWKRCPPLDGEQDGLDDIIHVDDCP